MSQSSKRKYSNISLVLGILTIVFSCTGLNIIFGIIAIILGRLGKTEDNKLYGTSIVGIITGIIGIVLSFIIIIILVNNPLMGIPQYWINKF